MDMISNHDKVANIVKLPPSEQSDYVPFFLGNDTPLSNSAIQAHKLDGDFVLVGTALFRSIEIACQLTININEVVPTIIIIDNSRNTSLAWQKIKEFFAAASPADEVREFLYKEDGLVALIEDLMDKKLLNADENIIRFFSKLFEHYPISYIQQMIDKLEVIEQDWANANTFTQIKEIYPDRPIVTYSSNIIDFVPRSESKIKILRNIEQLNPHLSLCTNFDKIKRKPTLGYILTDNNPLTFCAALQLADEVKQGVSNPEAPMELSEETKTAKNLQEIFSNDIKP